MDIVYSWFVSASTRIVRQPSGEYIAVDPGRDIVLGRLDLLKL